MKESPHRMIACILPKGRSRSVVRALKGEKGIIRTSVNNARGIGRFVHPDEPGAGQPTEKEVLSVVVTCAAAEEVFAFIHARAGIGEPHGGMMYMYRLAHATPFFLPDVPEEEGG